MKDYYYFLGVEKSATEEEIRRAYRKLSLKYHPDKNPGDPFFEERFREANEAYDTLSNPDARKVYDANSGTAEKSARNSLPPHIKNFSANKIRAKKGDEIIINWQTQNADLVKILPFGLEKNYGERSFRITEFTAGQFHIVLQATNTLINKSVVQGITITEVFENEADRIKNDMEKLFRPQQKAQVNPRGRSKFMLWLAALILFAAALIFLLKA